MKSASNIFASLGTGIDGAIHRPNNQTEDRHLREMIETANRNGDLIIPTGDRHYYRPDMSKETDRCNAHQYILKEQARVNSMMDKLIEMMKTYNALASRYQEG